MKVASHDYDLATCELLHLPRKEPRFPEIDHDYSAPKAPMRISLRANVHSLDHRRHDTSTPSKQRPATMSSPPKETAEYLPPPYPPPFRDTELAATTLARLQYFRQQAFRTETQARRDAAHQRHVDEWLQEQRRRALEDWCSGDEEAVMATPICGTCGVRGHTKETHRHPAGAAQGLPIRLKSDLAADSSRELSISTTCLLLLFTDFIC
jgi:hypothetical protein